MWSWLVLGCTGSRHLSAGVARWLKLQHHGRGPYRAGMHVVSQGCCLDTAQCWAGLYPLHQLTLELMDHGGVWGRSGGVRVMVGTLQSGQKLVTNM